LAIGNSELGRPEPPAFRVPKRDRDVIIVRRKRCLYGAIVQMNWTPWTS
jgi:hypothetical protein